MQNQEQHPADEQSETGIDAEFKHVLFPKITLTMAGLFIIILASLLVISQYFAEKKMKDDGFIN